MGKFTAAFKKLGKNISAKELTGLEEQLGDRGINRVQKYAEREGIGYRPGAKDWLNTYKKKQKDDSTVFPAANNTQLDYIETTGGFNIPAGKYSQQEYEYIANAGLIQLQGQIDKELYQIKGLTDTQIAGIQADATKYGYDQELAAQKYIADMDLLKGTKVAEIEGKNRIDLQAIVNAGMKEIEGMRSETEKDVARITGKFGVEQEETRQSGQRDIARMGMESSYYNSLIGAFGF